MTTTDGGLHTLTYQIDPDALGELTLYPLTSSFRSAWDHFEKTVRRRSNRWDITPRYSNLATALTAVTGQPIRLFPAKDLSRTQKSAGADSLLVTTEPIDPWLLTTAVRTFERLSLDNDNADTLAEHLTGLTPEITNLSEYVDYSDGRVSAPGWIYRIAQWNLAAKIAEQPLLIDGHLPIRLRLDSEANLVAWNDPISRTWSNGPRHATVYLDTSIVTLPGATHLYLRIDAHLARMPHTWWNVKTAWIAPHDDRQPLLRLPVRGPWLAKNQPNPIYRDHVIDILHACQLNPLPPLPDAPVTEPTPVRLIGNPSTHPIGKAPGARFLFQTQQQLQQRLGLPEPVYRRTKITTRTAATGFVPPNKIDQAISASGAAGIRIVCLYGDQTTRHRMIDTLSTYANTDTNPLVGAADDTPIALTPRLSVVFHYNPHLVAHGDHPRDLDELTCLNGEDNEAVINWVETSWHGSTVEHDAKPTLRTEFGKRGIVAQFLNANYTPKRSRRRKDGTIPPAEDHPAQSALRDLFRQAGVIDDRLAAATTTDRNAPLTRPTTLVGVHIRQHTPRRTNGIKEPNRLVVQMVAIHATPRTDEPWHVEMYDDTEGWISYRQANARYYASAIGNADLNRTHDKAPLVREYVDQALSALPQTVPLVIFADAEACQGIWPGLTHPRFGGAAVPGSTSGHPDLAVVRCASETRTLRPSHQDHTRRVTDPHKPDLPRVELYEHEENGIQSWLLAQPSRIHRSGPEGRAGTDYTRWTLPENRDRWMQGNWHGLTAIEIAVARPGTWQPRDLAALTARLCNQAATWDDRTRLPSPLHLAKSSDEDHPGHPPEDDPTDEA